MREPDLIVVGAGPAGTAAAVAAARRGCPTLLIERHGFAGGMATAGLVNPFLGNYYRNHETGRDGDLSGGVFAELLDRLRDRCAARRYRFGEGGSFYDAFDEVVLRVVYDELLADAGVQVLFHGRFVDAEAENGRVASIRVATKAGLREFRASTFVDATGDADLAAACGVPFDVGRDEDGLCQPCSTMFNMGGIDKDALLADGLPAARRAVGERFRAAKAAGRLDFPFRSWVAFYEYPRPGVLHFNATRMQGRPALTGEELTRVEIEGRRQADRLARWLAAEVPEFRRAYLESLAPHVGVRETRRIRGRYRMTRDDVIDGARFDDGIARSGYFIDIHAPTGSTDPHAGPDADSYRPKRYYEVPFRCLQPANFDNLLVACRAISTTFEAHAATRVMATMHAVGEAAGIAAALAREAGGPVGELDGRLVRAELPYLGAPLGF
ncbi:MAG: FAD-dependent oxidoreductase [Planctomycetota bacterium]